MTESFAARELARKEREAELPDGHVDYDLSMMRLAGRWFPIVALLCPPWYVDVPGRPLIDRMLGGTPHTGWFIPAESGLLFSVDHIHDETGGDWAGEWEGMWALTMFSRVCRLTDIGDGRRIYLPWSVDVAGGALLAIADPGWLFVRGGAEPEWMTQFMDRMSRLPLPALSGPEVIPIPAAEARQIWADAHNLTSGQGA